MFPLISIFEQVDKNLFVFIVLKHLNNFFFESNPICNTQTYVFVLMNLVFWSPNSIPTLVKKEFDIWGKI